MPNIPYRAKIESQNSQVRKENLRELNHDPHPGGNGRSHRTYIDPDLHHLRTQKDHSGRLGGRRPQPSALCRHRHAVCQRNGRRHSGGACWQCVYPRHRPFHLWRAGVIAVHHHYGARQVAAPQQLHHHSRCARALHERK